MNFNNREKQKRSKMALTKKTIKILNECAEEYFFEKRKVPLLNLKNIKF